MNPPSIWVRIRDIGPGNENLILRGMIVRKQDPRVIRSKQDNTERCVWSFTLRDSPVDLINISVWGSPDYVKQLASQFRVGDIGKSSDVAQMKDDTKLLVSLIDVKVIFRKFRDDEFQPIASSSFEISMNENQSLMFVDPKYAEEFEYLRAIPTKMDGNFLTINDIVENGEKLKGQFVNSLAAVRDVQPRRQFTSKTGQPLECRDVILIDESYKTLVLTVWGADLMSMSENWISRKTVLFLADVRVDWNNFKKIFIVSTTGRSIITENPQTSKAQFLTNFLTSVPFQASGKLEQIVSKYTDLSTINKVMSCQTVLTTAQDNRQSNEFPALVFALLESFDIDSSEDRMMISKCMRCHFKVDSDMAVCLNANCSSASGLESPIIERVYNLRVNLLDHTGHLMNCKLVDTVAAKLIGYKAPLFSKLSDEEKTAIKWRHLLKYFAARIVVLPIREKPPVISILSLESISINELSCRMPIF